MRASFIIFGLALLFTSVDAGPCDGHRTCGGCNSDLRCGWCGATRSCMEGNKTGDVSMCSSKWQFGVCDEVEDECPTFSNCTACTMHSFCGWCSSANRCLNGHKEGPANDECTFWDYNTCRNRQLPTTKKTAKGSTKTFGWRGRYGERICRTSNEEVASVEQTVELSPRSLIQLRINSQNATDKGIKVTFARSGKRLATRKTCGQLGWEQPKDTLFLCASALNDAGAEPAAADISVAMKTCSSQGARLCTQSEAKSALDLFMSQTESKAVPDKRELWTGTKCATSTGEDGYMMASRKLVHAPRVVRKGSNNDDAQRCYPDGPTKANVRCCGSKGEKKIAESKYKADCASRTNVTFWEAEQICNASDLRLCTNDELMQNYQSLSGCAFDNTYIWTSDICETPGDIAGPRIEGVAVTKGFKKAAVTSVVTDEPLAVGLNATFPSITVLSNEHSTGEINRGKFFHFSIAAWTAAVGQAPENEERYKVKNSRSGKVGFVKIYTRVSGGSSGDAHGRFDDNEQAAGDWQPGDKILFVEALLAPSNASSSVNANTSSAASPVNASTEVAFMEIPRSQPVANSSWGDRFSCKPIETMAHTLCCSDDDAQIQPQVAMKNVEVRTLMRINMTEIAANDFKGKLNILSNVEKATLSINMMQKQVDVSIHQFVTKFDESSVTFANCPPFNQAALDSVSKNASTGASSVGWVDFDLTPHISKIMAPPQYNEGLLIKSNLANAPMQLTDQPMKLTVKWKQQRLDPLCPQDGKPQSPAETGALKHSVIPF